ncbi:secreted frizzled-related protein 2-like isoform X2 [Branchiostoma floridae]|uniref:Secreted frizzled-related protein 2-like isoform X2 n=1 Tax=Branchiostoma floridae TaxID=7739 RepID=A0A9J7LDM2_BRAFL|nr:secreted frizzled-related protein 2-like isoform X2 [Branchiostoma floridae]
MDVEMLVLLPLVLAVTPSLCAGMGYSYMYVSDQPRKCVQIPQSLVLCDGLAYNEMRLPNLLGHENLDEVQEQARSWVPLLAQRCHPDTKLFLCSLFTPVCLEQDIFPCRSLCEGVRDSCAPVMAQHGFPWPKMLKCDKYPPDNDMCIKSQTTPGSCIVCLEEGDDRSSDFCSSDVVLRVRVEEKHFDDGDLVFTTKKKVRVFHASEALGGGRRRLNLPVQDMEFRVIGGEKCACSALARRKPGQLLLSARRDGSKFFVTSVRKWQKGDKAFKRLLRSMRDMTC